jgi:hypothetical protein
MVGLLAVVAALTGCATDQETINRVQPDGAIQKSLLEGEWYTMGTVVDTDYGAATFVGATNEFSRVKFEIQRDFLVVRRALEHIREIEGVAASGDDREKNAILAMFPILDHFDIKRDYNPVTGEEQNVIGENTVDRPWYEREFIRVDWKSNILDGSSAPVGGLTFGGIKLKPAQYWDQAEDENSRLKPRFEKNEEGKLVYFDFVNKYIAEPVAQKVDMGDGTMVDIPACQLIATSYLDCAPGNIRLRHSFRKVEDRDYEPFIYTADRMEHYGFFLGQRDGYDRDYGLSRFERNRFVARHNIWMASHKKSDAGELLKCTKDADCGGGGSKCDVAWAAAYGQSKGACTIPHREREIRKIAYHLTTDFPADLIDTSFDLVNEWDQAFRSTVASLRRLECEENKGSNCAQYTPESVGSVYVACHNPVAAGDDAACGAEGTIVEIGDIRYNMLTWINEAHAASPLGFGPSFQDPYTGETLSAVANVYGSGVDYYAAYARDLIAMLLGDLKVTDWQDDAAYLDWITNFNRESQLQQISTREADHHVIKIDGDDAEWAAKSMNFDWVRERAKNRLGQLTPAKSAKELGLQIAAAKKALGLIGQDMALAPKGRANLSSLVDTEMEQLLIDDETYLLAGQMPPSLTATSGNLSADALNQYSPLRGMSSAGLQRQRDVQRALSLSRRHCMLGEEFVDAGLTGLAKAVADAAKAKKPMVWYGKEYPLHGANGKVDYDKVKAMLRHPIYHAVMAHEVGHTLGLRHNFSGSYDALNYKPEYWKLRDDGSMRPRAYDPMTAQESDGRIREYQYSTVMDYGHNFIVTDPHGIAHYDHAAIKMGYGDLAEVFTKVPAQNVQTVAQLVSQVNSGAIGMLDPAFASGTVRFIPYTEWPSLVGGVANLQARTDVRYTSLQQVSSAVFGSSDAGLSADGKMPAVPYIYCGDEFSNFQAHCNTYDAGADPYETLQSMVDAYWEYYPISHFMHQRLNFNYAGVPARSMDRYFSRLESAARIYSFYRGIFESIAASGGGGADFATREDGLGPYTLGVRAAFDLMRRIIATPEPGRHTQAVRPDGTTALVQGGAQVFDPQIDTFNGRYLRTGFDFGPDFSWIFFSRSGFFHDKRMAMEILMKSENQFIAQDTDADARQFATSMYTLFPEEINEMFRGMIANDWRSFAPRRDAAGTFMFPTGDQVLKRGEGMTGTITDPNVGFSLQVWAMATGWMYSPTNFTQGFINKARLFAKGSADALDLSVPVIEWTDSETGITYVAPSYLDADGVETGIGASMLNWAILLESKGLNAELRDWVDNIDIMRWMTHHFGKGQHPFP